MIDDLRTAHRQALALANKKRSDVVIALHMSTREYHIVLAGVWAFWWTYDIHMAGYSRGWRAPLRQVALVEPNRKLGETAPYVS